MGFWDYYQHPKPKPPGRHRDVFSSLAAGFEAKGLFGA